MKFEVYGFLVLFGVFIVLLLINPNLSCFGKRLKSPFYPLLRRQRRQREQVRLRQDRQKQLKTEDYGFKLADEESKTGPSAQAKAKAEDYGFKLD